MRARLSRMRPRDVVLFLVATAVVAMVGVIVGREAGIGRQTGASVQVASTEQDTPSPQQSSEQNGAMTLTLTAPETCEVEFARNVGSWDLTKAKQVFVPGGWRVDQEVPVRWRVEGGTPPYTLVIDGEARDADGNYEGQHGEARISCVISPGERYFEETHPLTGVRRLYKSEPDVDSGWKKIRGVVTDANGGTAEASVDVYLIYVTDDYRDLLKRGETYRVFERLITMPASFDAVIDGHAQIGCEAGAVDCRAGLASSIALVGVSAGVTWWESDFTEEGRWNRTVGGADGTGPASVDEALDELANSVGRMPQRTKAGE